MSKLPRVTQKLFAGNAQPTDTAAFGTMRTGNPTYTSDIAQLMNTPQFLQGWLAAVEEGFAPFMEEMTGVQKVFAQQIAYLFQQGVPEYDAGTTYYKGSLVKVISDTDFVIYSSLIDDNTGNTPTAGAQWKLVYNTADPMQLVSNMEQTLTQSTTKYPSSKAVYDAFSTISPDLYLQYNRVARGILSAPSKPSYSDMQITIPAGIVIEVPNGFKSDGSLNYTDYTTQANTFDIDTSVIGTSGTGIFFYNTTSNTGGSVLKSAYYDGYTQPTGVNAQYAVWYDRSTNLYKFTSDTGSSWSQVSICSMGEFTIASSAVTSFIPYNNLSLLLENDLSAAESRIISIMNTKKTVFDIRYNSWVEWSSGFTAPQAGIAEAVFSSGTDGYPTNVAVNGETIPFCDRVSAGVSKYVAIIFLNKGDTVTYSTSASVEYRRFYPAN